MEKKKINGVEFELPSKGIVYSKDNPLSKGVIELKYPTAREEDILTSQGKDTIERFLNALVLTPDVNLNDMVNGDKDALLMASRIITYGPDYNINIQCTNCKAKNQVNVNLNEMSDIEFDESKMIAPNTNEFEFILPHSKKVIRFKLITGNDENAIHDLENTRRRAKMKEVQRVVSDRLKASIISVDGNADTIFINNFVDDDLRSLESKELRKYIELVSPAYNYAIGYTCDTCNSEEGVMLPLTAEFFFPTQ